MHVSLDRPCLLSFQRAHLSAGWNLYYVNKAARLNGRCAVHIRSGPPYTDQVTVPVRHSTDVNYMHNNIVAIGRLVIRGQGRGRGQGQGRGAFADGSIVEWLLPPWVRVGLGAGWFPWQLSLCSAILDHHPSPMKDDDVINYTHEMQQFFAHKMRSAGLIIIIGRRKLSGGTQRHWYILPVVIYHLSWCARYF